ncbi:MAG: hypothetical protein JWN32_3849 [Solirubrobacterales bacterium]|nr:hypothetical protein [Solirubrobacterales bacterium]
MRPVVVLVVLMALGGSAYAHGLASHRRCFGAASRDPAHPCHNPRLDRSVFPTPSEAQITPNAACRPSTIHPIEVCAFGERRRTAKAAVVLLGDSHAEHWRAAVEVVARAQGWRGLSITHASCPFSAAVRVLGRRASRGCVRWKGHVRQWFVDHPAVRTVFVSETSGGRGVRSRGGRSVFATAVRGYRRAWTSLPRSVEHIVVIRDTPKSATQTLTCVAAAIRNRARAGDLCALPRGRYLDRDPAAVAAARYRRDRAQSIDLTPFFCGTQRCYPVVGGALVYKDTTHITRAFAGTLGPYLLAKVKKLMRRW